MSLPVRTRLRNGQRIKPDPFGYMAYWFERRARRNRLRRAGVYAAYALLLAVWFWMIFDWRGK